MLSNYNFKKMELNEDYPIRKLVGSICCHIMLTIACMLLLMCYLMVCLGKCIYYKAT